MTDPVRVGELLPGVLAEVVDRAGHGYARWAEQVAATGYLHPSKDDHPQLLTIPPKTAPSRTSLCTRSAGTAQTARRKPLLPSADRGPRPAPSQSSSSHLLRRQRVGRPELCSSRRVLPAHTKIPAFTLGFLATGCDRQCHCVPWPPVRRVPSVYRRLRGLLGRGADSLMLR
jgi:hypothetical protein